MFKYQKYRSLVNLSGATKKNYRSTLRAAWGYFERKDYIQKNIAVSLECPKIAEEEIKFLSVPEVEQLLRANEKVDPEICGLMALGLFAGMRSSAKEDAEKYFNIYPNDYIKK